MPQQLMQIKEEAYEQIELLLEKFGDQLANYKFDKQNDKPGRIIEIL